MERGSDKVSPRQDEALKHDTEGMVRGGHATHAEEWKGSEPAGEDQPEVRLAPDDSLRSGQPGDMTAAEVEARSALASYVGRAPYPLDKSQLVELVRERNAPDRVLDQLSALPEAVEFQNLQDIWLALGGHVEQTRS